MLAGDNTSTGLEERWQQTDQERCQEANSLPQPPPLNSSHKIFLNFHLELRLGYTIISKVLMKLFNVCTDITSRIKSNGLRLLKIIINLYNTI